MIILQNIRFAKLFINQVSPNTEKSLCTIRKAPSTVQELPISTVETLVDPSV